MAAPVFGAATLLTEGTAANAVVAVPSGVAADTVIVVTIYKESTAAVTPPSGFTEVTPPAQTTGTIVDHRIFWKRATGADSGTYTFSWTGSTWRQASAVSVTGCVTTGSPVDVSNQAARSSAATATPGVAVTTTDTDRLLIWSATNDNGGSWTAPSGFTLRASNSLCWTVAATATQTAAGASGTKTGSCSTSAFSTAWLVALFSQAPATPIAATDSGTGTDATPTILNISTVTETGTGTETPTILRSATVTDSATGTDTPAIQILTPIVVSDTGTGVDTPTIFPFVPIAATDSGTGLDSVTLAITDLKAQSDTGTGTDTTAILDMRAGISDSATGSDTAAIQRAAALSDSAIGVDDVAIIDIPFTQILPLFRQGVVYDLVVMARIPQVNGIPQFIEVDPIEWATLNWTNALSTAQELSATCLIASLPPTIITRLRDLATQPTELWLSRNGKIVFAGPIQGGTVNGENLTLTAKGLMTYLMGMFVTSDLVFKAVDQFQIVKGLVDHWQNLDYGNFGIDTTHITNSGVTMDVNYLKTELDNIGQKIIDMGKSATGFDIEVDPSTRQLQLWYPTKGVDKSVGEDAVVFDARNISSSDIMFSVGPGDVASEGFGTGTATNSGDGSTYSAKANLELRAKYGRTGIAASFSNVDSQTVLDTFVQALIDARQAALMVPGPHSRDVPDADLSSYSVGDTILYQPNELLTISTAYRIRKQTVAVSGNNQETLSLEFV